MELVGYIQNYEWGKIGSSSRAALLSGDSIDPSTPYAELWFGTHPNGNANLKEFNVSLQSYLTQHPNYLGTALKHWNKHKSLPFLLKVLSVRKALSIQVHPDKLHAEVLHQDYPLLYLDPNHKPEMAIALTPFRALCGFRSPEELKEVFVNVTELQLLITPSLILSYQETLDDTLLKKILFSMLTKEDDLVEFAITKFLRRFEEEDELMKEKFRYHFVKQLHDQFPADSGAFMVFFLNIVTLEPGEAMYIPPGMPHAYLSGDCVECMATSDNVVRAGLTPKYKDIEVLLDIIDYASYSPEGLKLKKKEWSEYTFHYHPPIPDFGVSQVCIPEDMHWVTPWHDSCQIFFVLEGEGTIMGEKLEDPIVSNIEPEFIHFEDTDDTSEEPESNTFEKPKVNVSEEPELNRSEKPDVNPSEKPEVNPSEEPPCNLIFKSDFTSNLYLKWNKKNKSNETETENIGGEVTGDRKSENPRETATAADGFEVPSSSKDGGTDLSRKRPRGSTSGEAAASHNQGKGEPVTNSGKDDKDKPSFEWGMKPVIKPVPRKFKDKGKAEREAEERRKFKTYLAKAKAKAKAKPKKSEKPFFEGILDKPPKEPSEPQEIAEREFPIKEIKLKVGSAIFLPALNQYVITPINGPLNLYFAYMNSDCAAHELSCLPFGL